MTAVVEEQAPAGPTGAPTAPGRSWRWWVGAVALVVTVAGARLGLADGAGAVRSQGATAVEAFPASAQIEAEYGVRFVQLDVLAAGGLVELRYVVVDPARSAAIHDQGGAHLPHIESPSGAVLKETPFHSHVAEQSAGTSYSILYRNDGGAVASGDTVDITVGDLRLAGVLVR